jgi:hypothetical protein
MAQRDQDLGDAFNSGSGFGFTVQVDCWNTGFIIDDFNVLHGGSGFDFTPSDLNMASLPTQRLGAANDDGGDG